GDGLGDRLAAAVARARVEVAVAAGHLLGERLAGHAVLLGAPVAALLLHRLAGGHRPADRVGHVAVAGLDHVLVGRAADVTADRLLDGLADGVADVAVAGLVARLADRVADLPGAGLADLLGHADGLLADVLLVDRLADGVADLLDAGFRHALGDAVRHL